MADRVVADMGRCIYCGADSYRPGNRKPLAEEHIVPFALNGDHVLRHASCRKCEEVTGRVEAKLLRNTLRGSRLAMGLQSRSNDPKKLPLFINITDNSIGGETGGEKIFLPIEDYPATLYLPILPRPPFLAALDGRVETSFHGAHFIKMFDENGIKLASRHGISEWAAGSLDMRIFCRAIAKIGHAWAVGTRDSFTPILSDILRDPDLESRDILPFVGCGPAKDPVERIYELDNLQTTVGSDTYYVTSVRLFAHLGAPTYYVVVGKPNGQAMPILPENPGGVDAVYNFYRMKYRAP